MLLSDLIKKLKEAESKYGDVEIVFHDPINGVDNYDCSICYDPPFTDVYGCDVQECLFLNIVD